LKSFYNGAPPSLFFQNKFTPCVNTTQLRWAFLCFVWDHKMKCTNGNSKFELFFGINFWFAHLDIIFLFHIFSSRRSVVKLYFYHILICTLYFFFVSFLSSRRSVVNIA
jgi:hypothetical protein